MSAELINQIKSARRVSVPLVAITTPDPAQTVELICAAVNGDGPRIVWDVVQGLRPRNEIAKEAIALMVGDEDMTIGNPLELLRVARKLMESGVLCMHFANRWIVDPMVMQAMWNLRDDFKKDRRTLILLGVDMPLPPELAGDVLVFDEALPDGDMLGGIVREQLVAAKLKIEPERVVKAVEAVQGLPAFQAEQLVAMSLSKDGMDIPNLWERKRRQIELTPGLKVNREAACFADIGGANVIKEFLGRIVRGNARPSAIIYLDEIEKSMAGSGADTSGVSQDQLGAMLSYMQDQSAAGCIFIGPPGSGKSAIAKAVGSEAGIPTVQLDLGALKGSLVGASEQNLRAALKVITSVSNGRSLWIATSNNISSLPPELRRRFTLGTFFFDLPDAEERKAIWKIWIKKYSLSAASPLPPDDGWTGAEIRQACDIAWRLGCKLVEAAKFVVPVSRSAADQLEKLRKSAEGKFLSASKPGVYSQPQSEVVTQAKRKMQFEE